jgi:DNA (cytosine-5)-methyltransferase 1
MRTEPLFIVVDLFCGAGGTTTGFEMTDDLAKVIGCVNHNKKAIKSHWLNHPHVKHFEEDIRTLDITALKKVVDFQRSLYPNAYFVLWASLPCPHFSKARGAQPKEDEMRTMAKSLYMKYDFENKIHIPGDSYIQILNPDYIMIENVSEFMSWGPLDKNGKPVSRKNGQEFIKWKNDIQDLGYIDDWKHLNSADFGAYTSRNRLFGVFAKKGLPIAWPEPTHSKTPSKFSMHGDLQRWKAVKEVLDFSDEGESIFNRKKPLSDKTLERIYAGLIKFVAKGDKAFISKYYSGKPAGKVNSVEQPAPTITTFGNQTLVQPQFLSSQNSSIETPMGTLTTKDRAALVQPEYFIDRHFGTYQNQSIEQPAGTIVSNDKHRLIKCEPFIMPTNYDNGPKSIEEPLQTITANRKHHYIVNPSHGGYTTSTEFPCPVIVARQDKAPLSIMQVEDGKFAVPIYADDSKVMVKIKEFMVIYELVDIKMRMLRVLELLVIQGFPVSYHLEGNQADQKLQIGNSVVPLVVKAWILTLGDKVREHMKERAA